MSAARSNPIESAEAPFSRARSHAYWAFHLEQEHQRNHVGRYEDGAIPDPLPAPKARLRRVK